MERTTNCKRNATTTKQSSLLANNPLILLLTLVGHNSATR